MASHDCEESAPEDDQIWVESTEGELGNVKSICPWAWTPDSLFTKAGHHHDHVHEFGFTTSSFEDFETQALKSTQSAGCRRTEKFNTGL